MKINTNSDKDKRLTNINLQKVSFLSTSPRNDASPRAVTPKLTFQPHDAYDNLVVPRVHKAKQIEDQGYTNIFADDSQSTQQFSRRGNYISTEDLGVSVKGLLNQVKNVRESQNIHKNDNIKTPPNSLNEKKISVTKSVSNLTKPNDEFLYIKSDIPQKQNEKQQDSEQNKQLLLKIKEVEASNQKIRQENIQLRLKKLSSNSQSMQMLALKLEIQELKRKIEKLRSQSQRSGQLFNEYYARKRSSNIGAKQLGYSRPKVSEYMSRTPSNLQPSASTTYIASNPYSITQPYSSGNYNPTLAASTLSKSRLLQDNKNKPKKYNMYSSVSPNNININMNNNNQQDSDDRLLIIRQQNGGEDVQPNSPERIYIRK